MKHSPNLVTSNTETGQEKLFLFDLNTKI